MDAFARALVAAQSLLDDGEYVNLRRERYSSFDSGKGKAFDRGRLSLESLRSLARQNGEPEQISGKQEYYENLISKFF
jgi:xylose isomerase